MSTRREFPFLLPRHFRAVRKIYRSSIGVEIKRRRNFTVLNFFREMRIPSTHTQYGNAIYIDKKACENVNVQIYKEKNIQKSTFQMQQINFLPSLSTAIKKNFSYIKCKIDF